MQLKTFQDAVPYHNSCRVVVTQNQNKLMGGIQARSKTCCISALCKWIFTLIPMRTRILRRARVSSQQCTTGMQAAMHGQRHPVLSTRSWLCPCCCACSGRVDRVPQCTRARKFSCTTANKKKTASESLPAANSYHPAGTAKANLYAGPADHAAINLIATVVYVDDA